MDQYDASIATAACFRNGSARMVELVEQFLVCTCLSMERGQFMQVEVHFYGA
jgi:hypothetical protein